MKYAWTLILFAFVFFLSCTPPSSNKTLNTDNLPLQEYTIDITKDTVLVTKNGALLKIPKGSLAANGNTVTLEIKEAYSLKQMIQGGMVTQANGKPLSSGGMIYINAKGGQDVKITQAIKVALPTDYLAEGMQLFKGQKDKNGNINWTEPVALPGNKQLSSIQRGQQLFQSKCANCHAIGKDLAGPDLAHFLKRFTGEELILRKYHYHYLDHASSDACDLYSYNLKKRFGSLGTLFPDLSDNDLDDIYRYVQNESDKNNLLLPSHAYLNGCIDSCSRYWEIQYRLEEMKETAKARKQNLKANNGSLVIEKKEPASPPATNEPIGPPPPVDFDERVSPQYYGAEYYQFTIETFGWFNIDILLKDVNGVEESELFVRITGEYREKIKVYLIIPSVKVYVEGGPAARNKEEFAFDLKSGKIMLPQNERAWIMAVTETEGTIAFALQEFTTALKQEMDVSLNKSSREAFNTAIRQISINGMNISVADSKNAAEIRKADAELKSIEQELKNTENLKPKNCDCDCEPKDTATAKEVHTELTQLNK
ncbi:MAG: cytochrome c [Chitinophagaceae bacterium]|nr:cytochrome c [Chitinophagaceae bacterium]